MTKNEEKALEIVAIGLDVPPQWLKNLIQFESGWNPQATNKYSGARGLLQFTNTTAKALGYMDADHLVAEHPDSVSQLLGPVQAYFGMNNNTRGPYPTQQSLYMAVFYPAARKWSPLQAFPEYVQKLNPGIKTVQDYVNKINRKSAMTGAAFVALLITGFILLKNIIKP